MTSRRSNTHNLSPTRALARWHWPLLFIALAGLLVAGSAQAQGSGPTVGRIRIDGAISPVMATYVGRGIDRAAARGDSAVIIQMDTPGGLSSAMDDIISDILASDIPVIVWVAPDGARAASAGTYIAYAAHISAMAATTNIGSATPVQLGNEDDDSESALDRKITNDAVAKIRSLAEKRGRNADWAEDAVRDAANVTASQAVELHVVDFIANDQEALLAQADGREVEVGGSTVTVHTAGASVHAIDMSLFERLLQVITDPNIAFVLVSLGTLAFVFELANPGGIGPGAIGGIMLVTGFYALGTLDTNWAGIALLALALLLFAIDVFVTTHGVLTVCGIIAFLFGSLLLSNTRNDDVLAVSRVVIFTMTALLGTFFLFIAGSAWRTHGLPAFSGDNAILAGIGVVRTDLAPDGMIYMQGELWQASAASGTIPAGTRVRVLTKQGLHLIVQAVPEEAAIPPPGAHGEPVT
jgi:membrane-bound serine protease (ClpP class)